MSYAIIRHEMYKNNKNILVNLYRHNVRLKNNYSNKNIDITKSNNNYFIKKADKTFYMAVKDAIESKDIESHIQKTSNVLCEFLVTSDNKFFESMTQGEQNQFFEDAYQFIANKIGEENILNATVHFDEDTPHMHVDYLPIVTINGKKKLSCRSIWKGKNTYHELQESYYNYITKEKGYNLERGEVGSIAKHLTVSELKDITNYEVKKQKENSVKIKYYNNELKDSKSVVSQKIETPTENTSIMKKGTYEKSEVDRIITKYQEQVNKLCEQSDKKDEVIKSLTEEYKSISEKRLIERAEHLERENTKLKDNNKKLQHLFNVIKTAFQTILHILQNIPIIKDILVKHELENNIICSYEKCESIEDIELVNKDYSYLNQNHAENEDEMEM